MSISLIASFSLVAASIVAHTAAEKTVTVLVSEDFTSRSEATPISQNAAQLFAYLEEETQVKLRIKRMPWMRALVAARAGEGFLYGASKTPEREKFLKFSEPIYADTVWLIKRCDSDLKFAQLADLKGKIIGVARGATYGDEFNQAANQIFRVEFDSNSGQQRLAKLLRKRTDATLLYSHVQNSKELEDNLNGRFSSLATADDTAISAKPFCVLPTPISTSPVHFAVAPGYEDSFMNQLNAALSKARASGKLAKIYSSRLPK